MIFMYITLLQILQCCGVLVYTNSQRKYTTIEKLRTCVDVYTYDKLVELIYISKRYQVSTKGIKCFINTGL